MSHTTKSRYVHLEIALPIELEHEVEHPNDQLTAVLDALNRHKKLRLNDNNLSLSLESAARVVKTERGPGKRRNP